MKQTCLFVVASLSMLWAGSPAKAAPPNARDNQGLIEMNAGELLLTLRVATNGIGVAGLRDLTLNEQLLAANALPLFNVTLRHAATKQDLRLTSEDGWLRTNVRRKRNGLELKWHQPANENLGAIAVIATATLDQKRSAVRWNLRVENASTHWGVWRVVFPQVAIADFGTNGAVLFPRGPGEVQRGLSKRAFRYISRQRRISREA